MTLYEKLKQHIIEGQYTKHQQLPSKRKLSEHLSLSLTTIEHAYQILVDEGYIYAKPRSGYYVSDIESLPIAHQQSHLYPDGISCHEQKKKHTEDKPKYAFNLAEIDTEHFPISFFRKCLKDIPDDMQYTLLQHGDQQGIYALRQEIAHYLFNSRGVVSHPNQIVVGSSTEQLIHILIDLLDDEGFIIEKPSYPPIQHVLQKKKRAYDYVFVEEDGISLDSLKKANGHIVYVTPSHQFPTGNIMNLKKRTQLLNWSYQERARYIIEDDYDSEFRYTGKPIPPLQSLDREQKVIYMSTFSKSLFPSCRVAYMVLPYALVERYHKQPYKEANTVPVHMQHIVTTFMRTGKFERHLNKMRKIYKRKLNYILSRIEQYPKQLEIKDTATGMHFILEVKNGKSIETCLKNAQKHSLVLTPYHQYDQRYINEPVFILGFGGIPESQLPQYMEALIQSVLV